MTNTSNDEDGKRTLYIVILVIAAAVAAILIPSPPDEVPVIHKEEPQAHLIEVAHAESPDHIVEADKMVVEKPVEKAVPDLRPELEVICSCESAGHTHKDANGKLLSGYVDPDDKGECQINTRYHGETMKSMELDITDDADYRTYANHLFDTQGRQPWMASAACWAPIIGY